MYIHINHFPNLEHGLTEQDVTKNVIPNMETFTVINQCPTLLFKWKWYTRDNDECRMPII